MAQELQPPSLKRSPKMTLLFSFLMLLVPLASSLLHPRCCCFPLMNFPPFWQQQLLQVILLLLQQAWLSPPLRCCSHQKNFLRLWQQTSPRGILKQNSQQVLLQTWALHPRCCFLQKNFPPPWRQALILVVLQVLLVFHLRHHCCFPPMSSPPS